MQVFDEINGKLVNVRSCRKVLVGHIPGQLIFGYINKEAPVEEIRVYSGGGFSGVLASRDKMKSFLVFSNKSGCYISKVEVPEDVLLHETLTKGRGRFPYHFEKRYEACENFRIFQGKQKVIDPDRNYTLANYLKYSFGLEFETSQGYVPEDICFRDGLIPLRDGSISGIEYSTVVLSGNEGIALLEQQLDSLRKYTDFNKECSLHIHVGGFPLDSKKLFNLYYICKGLESEISTLVPKYTFNTDMYKANHKNYCGKLGTYRNFNQLYEHLVGRKFFNDFTQPHPNDIRREAKWHIPTRYYWVNFINALCYDVNKTIEFRFLRPTYNFQKIILWLYILNAIMRFAEEHMGEPAERISLTYILRKVYPEELAERLFRGVCKLNILKRNQSENEDFIGQTISAEEEIFSEDLGI